MGASHVSGNGNTRLETMRLQHNSYLSLVIDEIKSLSTSFSTISFSHVYREVNIVAHSLVLPSFQFHI